MNQDFDEMMSKILVGVSVLVFVGVILFATLQPYFESKAFNECTGGNSTYFTAFFTELRVQECNKK